MCSCRDRRRRRACGTRDQDFHCLAMGAHRAAYIPRSAEDRRIGGGRQRPIVAPALELRALPSSPRGFRSVCGIRPGCGQAFESGLCTAAEPEPCRSIRGAGGRLHGDVASIPWQPVARRSPSLEACACLPVATGTVVGIHHFGSIAGSAEETSGATQTTYAADLPCRRLSGNIWLSLKTESKMLEVRHEETNKYRIGRRKKPRG